MKFWNGVGRQEVLLLGFEFYFGVEQEILFHPFPLNPVKPFWNPLQDIWSGVLVESPHQIFPPVPEEFFFWWINQFFLDAQPIYFKDRTMKRNLTFYTDEGTLMKLQVISGKGFINQRDFQNLIQSLIDNTYEKKSKR